MKQFHFALLAALTALASSASAVTYGLASDWSDTINPNNTWSYGVSDGTSFTAFSAHVSNYINVGPPAFTSSQQAWTDCANTGSNGCPEGLARSAGVSTSDKDFPLGRIGGHTPVTGWLAVQWTAPSAGTVGLVGDVWTWQDFGRTLITTVRINGVQLFAPATIPIRASGTTSSNPFTFAQAAASSGASVGALENMVVRAGDKIVWMAAEAPGSTEWFVGVDMTVNFTPVPEPSVINLFGVGLATMLLVIRRNAVARLA